MGSDESAGHICEVAFVLFHIYSTKRLSLFTPVKPSLCLLSCLQLLDMKVFVETDSDIRLIRRLKRDVSQRGRDINGIIKQYNKFVKPAFEQYIEPTVQVADIVVPKGQQENTNTI